MTGWPLRLRRRSPRRSWTVPTSPKAAQRTGLAYREKKTSAQVAESLQSWGYEVARTMGCHDMDETTFGDPVSQLL